MTHQKNWLYLVGSAAALVLAACTEAPELSVSTPESTAASEPASSATPAPEISVPATPAKIDTAGSVEIALIDKLDGVTSEYCIDIAGGNKNIDISKGLQAHTCYSYRGAIGTDQSFVTAKFGEGQLYMTDFDVCATASELSAGAAIGLANCDGGDLQTVAFSGNGTISMVASPELCFTAAKDSRFGRSKVHQIKALSLEACSDELAPYQQWRGRATAD